MAVNEGPDREFYETFYARRGTAKKKLPRERLAKPKEQKGFFFNPSRRRVKPDRDELEQKFISEMEAAGRYDLADDESGVAFDIWCARHGYDYR